MNNLLNARRALVAEREQFNERGEEMRAERDVPEGVPLVALDSDPEFAAYKAWGESLTEREAALDAADAAELGAESSTDG